VISATQTDAPLACLIGRKLTAVVFVLDDVQFQFDEIVLSVYTSAAVRSFHGNTVQHNDQGWRDALCGQMSRVVSTVEIRDAEFVVLFDDESAILVSLRDEDYRGPEALCLSGGKKIVVI